MTIESKNFDLNSTTLLQAAWQYRKVLIAVGVLAFIISTVAAFLITPKFEASAIIFPPKANQASKELFTVSQQAGLTTFGETEEAEQFLQVLTSRTLRDSVIQRLNLMDYWGIKSSDKYAQNHTYSIYKEVVKIKSTPYQSIVIEVMDKNPEMAAKIANTIVDLSDSLMRSIKLQFAQKALAALELQYEQTQADMRSIEDSLAMVMQKGVVHLKKQSEEYYKEYTKALLANNRDAIKIIKDQIQPLQLYGSKYERYRDEMNYMSQQLTNLNNSLKIYRVEAAQTIPSQFVIDRAIVPDKKAYPKRSVVIILSTLASLFFAFFAIVFAEFIKQSIVKK